MYQKNGREREKEEGLLAVCPLSRRVGKHPDPNTVSEEKRGESVYYLKGRKEEEGEREVGGWGSSLPRKTKILEVGGRKERREMG